MIELRIVENELGVKPDIQYRFMLFSVGQGGYLCPPNPDMKWSEWRTWRRLKMIEIQKNYKLTLTEQQAKELYWILKDVNLDVDNELKLVYHELKKLFDSGIR